jgi:hypothetical protein
VKAGLTRFTCTKHFEDPNDGTSDSTLLVACEVAGRGLTRDKWHAFLPGRTCGPAC